MAQPRRATGNEHDPVDTWSPPEPVHDRSNGPDRRELDRFLQTYAVEAAKLEAHRKGYTTFEQSLADGSIKLTIQVAGGAH